MHFDWQAFAPRLTEELDVDIRIENVEPVSGGDISRAFKLTTNQMDFFVKLNRPDAEEMFRAEWAGLAELSCVGSAKVPEPVCLGVTQNTAFFVMEHLELVESLSQAQAGKVVAEMHLLEHTRFGWDQNNFVGKTVQHNSWHSDWSEFYWNCRLEPQLIHAVESGFSVLERAIEPLHDKTMAMLMYHSMVPSLLHGDLWHGNISTSVDSEIVIFDPAVYWGDPETDIAMTHIFGGFDEAFYEAYYEIIPRQEGSDSREPLYQLYHWLNHLNQFGQSYLEPTLNCMSRLYEN